jgi:hypothetical protein
MRTLLCLVALALVMVPAGRSAPPSPQPVCSLPALLLGNYLRYDDPGWELTFNTDCTYQATQHGREEGGGDYLFSIGDESGGSFQFSNDRGCRQPGLQDLPTWYDYTFERRLLLLQPEGGMAADLCSNTKGEGRAHELAGHGGWIKAVAGKVKLALKGAKKGTFVLSGVLEDAGSFRVSHSTVKKGVKRSTLRFTGLVGTFSVTESVKKGKVSWSLTGPGSAGFRYLAGGGSGTATGSRQSLRGDVSN